MAESKSNRDVPFWMQMLLAACGLPIAIAGVWAIGSSVLSYLQAPSAVEVEAANLSELRAGRTLDSFSDTIDRSPAYRVALNDEWSYYMYESKNARVVTVVNETRSVVVAYSIYPRTEALLPSVSAGGLKIRLNDSSFADAASLPDQVMGYCGATREGYWEVEGSSGSTGFQIMIPSNTTEAIDGADPGIEGMCPLISQVQSCFDSDIGTTFVGRNPCLTDFEADRAFGQYRHDLVVNSATVTMPGVKFDRFMVVTPEEVGAYQSNDLRYPTLPTFADLQFHPSG